MLIYICNRLWLSSDLQHVDNLVVSDQLVFQTSNTRDIKYNLVDWSIILCVNNHKTRNGTGAGRRTVTMAAFDLLKVIPYRLHISLLTRDIDKASCRGRRFGVLDSIWRRDFFYFVDSSFKYASETRWTTSVAHSASTMLADIVRSIVIDKALAIAISLPSGKFDKCSTIFNHHGNFWAPRNMVLNRFLQGFSDRYSKITERKLRILQYTCFWRLFDEKN